MKWNKLNKKEQDEAISLHFKAREFSCKCMYQICTTQNLSKDLVDKLELVRERFGKAIKITSGCRCEAHNDAEGGKTKSKHLFTDTVECIAADIAPYDLKDLDSLYTICYDVFQALGKAKTFIHVDLRPAKADGSKTLWVY